MLLYHERSIENYLARKEFCKISKYIKDLHLIQIRPICQTKHMSTERISNTLTTIKNAIQNLLLRLRTWSDFKKHVNKAVVPAWNLSRADVGFMSRTVWLCIAIYEENKLLDIELMQSLISLQEVNKVPISQWSTQGKAKQHWEIPGFKSRCMLAVGLWKQKAELTQLWHGRSPLWRAHTPANSSAVDVGGSLQMNEGCLREWQLMLIVFGVKSMSFLLLGTSLTR